MNTIQKAITEIKSFIRWHDWAIDKLPILFTICFYLILSTGHHPENIEAFFVFLVFSVCSTVYGYAINNYADLGIDIRQGKPNQLAKLNANQRILILLFILLIVIFSGSYFVSKPYFLSLWIIQFFIATFYSLKPIRFKERGMVGLVIPFLAQLVLPVMICFSIFGDLFSSQAVVFILYGFFKGGAYDIGHQFHDYAHDLKTRTKTFAVERGQKIVAVLFKSFLVIERILFAAVLFLIGQTIWVTSGTFEYIIFISFAFMYLLLLVFVFFSELQKKEIADPYYVEVRGLANILHIIFPNMALPLGLTVLLSTIHLKFILFSIFYLIWILPTPSKLKWPVQAILNKVK